MTQQESYRHAPIERAFTSPEVDSTSIRIEIPMSGNCTRPARVASAGGKENEYRVRCRSCPGCLRARQHLWRLRSQWEVLHHRNNWLFTGTYRDQSHDYRPVAEEVTRWLKRLRIALDRRKLGEKIRYLVMFERHKSGAFHMHTILHSHQRIPLDVLRRPWTAGFSDVKLCDLRGSGYVVKYSTKSLLDNTTRQRPRIRSSHGYGRAVMLSDKEAVKEAMADRPPVLVHRTWTENLIDALNQFATDEGSKPVWEFLMEVQKAHGTVSVKTTEGFVPITIDRQEVDTTTGEVLPYGKPRQSRAIHPETIEATRESRIMGILYRNNLLGAMEVKLISELERNGLLLKPESEPSTTTSTESSTTTKTTAPGSRRRRNETSSQDDPCEGGDADG